MGAASQLPRGGPIWLLMMLMHLHVNKKKRLKLAALYPQSNSLSTEPLRSTSLDVHAGICDKILL